MTSKIRSSQLLSPQCSERYANHLKVCPWSPETFDRNTFLPGAAAIHVLSAAAQALNPVGCYANIHLAFSPLFPDIFLSCSFIFLPRFPAAAPGLPPPQAAAGDESQQLTAASAFSSHLHPAPAALMWLLTSGYCFILI